MMSLFLVRHGQTVFNQRKAINGCTVDVLLTSVGREEAAQVGWALQNEHFTCIAVSSMRCTLQTMSLIMTPNKYRIDTPIDCKNELREMNVGSWDGQPLQKVQNLESWQDFRNYPRRFDERWATTIGAETYAKVYRRVTVAVQALIDRYADGKILIVAHGLTFSVLVNSLMGGSIETIHDVPMMRNASITRLDISSGGRVHLVGFNQSVEEYIGGKSLKER